MKFVLGRGPLAVTLRRCLMTTLPATGAAAAAAWVLHRLTRPALELPATPAVASPWLTLPLAVAAAGTALTAAATWPLFARQRPGAEQVQRIARGPLAGRGAVVAAALLAQWLLSLPLTTLLADSLGAPPRATPYVAAESPARPVLAAAGQRLVFALPAAMRAEGVVLRPLAGLPTGALAESRIVVTADGEPLGQRPLRFVETRELRRLTFAPRQLDRLELTLQGGDVPLLFPPGSVVLVGARDRSGWANGLLAATVAVLPSFVALGLACLLGLVATWPTLATAIVVALFVQWIGGVGPVDDTVLALLRGRWLAAGPLLGASAPGLALGSGAMLVAALSCRAAVRPHRPWR